jgi:hypothetical protein
MISSLHQRNYQRSAPLVALVICGLSALVCGILALPALTRTDHRVAREADAGPAADAEPEQIEAHLS